MTSQQEAAMRQAREVLETGMRDAADFGRISYGEFLSAITALTAALEQPAQQELIDSGEKAGVYMEARLWEFIDMAAAWPEASPDQRTWDHVMVYAPKPAQQEHVAWVCEGSSSDEKHAIDYWPGDVDDLPIGTKLYTRPQAREWVGLTNEEWRDIVDDDNINHIGAIKVAIEAKLREKNA